MNNTNADELKGYRQAITDVVSIIRDTTLLDEDYDNATFSFMELRKGAEIIKKKLIEKLDNEPPY